jgi:hypothetical protein
VELATTLLDVLGLLLVAAGVCALVFPWLGWGGLAVSGAVVLAGSFLGARLGAPKPPAAGSDG